MAKWSASDTCRMANNELCICIQTKNAVSSRYLAKLRTTINAASGVNADLCLLKRTNPAKSNHLTYLEYLQVDKPALDLLEYVESAIKELFPGSKYSTFVFNNVLDKVANYHNTENETKNETT